MAVYGDVLWLTSYALARPSVWKLVLGSNVNGISSRVPKLAWRRSRKRQRRWATLQQLYCTGVVTGTREVVSVDLFLAPYRSFHRWDMMFDLRVDDALCVAFSGLSKLSCRVTRPLGRLEMWRSPCSSVPFRCGCIRTLCSPKVRAQILSAHNF